MAFKYNARAAQEYRDLWNGLTVLPGRRAEAFKYARKIFDNKARYQTIEAKSGVPWHFVGLAHYRESTLDWNKNLANGQPLNMRTTIVPAGRGPYRTFEESALDSLINVQGYRRGMDWSLPLYIYRIEGYNGYGYHGYGIPSPYLVGGSNKQKRGKYVADHVFSRSTWDTQLGVLTILKALIEIDPSITFGGQAAFVPPPPDVEDEPETPIENEAVPPSPRAEDETKPAIKSKIVGLSLGGILSGVAAFATDWRVLTVVMVGIFALIIADLVFKLDIKGWFR
jgi:lysozyme family protein